MLNILKITALSHFGSGAAMYGTLGPDEETDALNQPFINRTDQPFEETDGLNQPFINFDPAQDNRIKIIAIRHGESIWNWVKNYKKQKVTNPVTGKPFGGNLTTCNRKLFGGGAHMDSPLTSKDPFFKHPSGGTSGEADAENLQRFFDSWDSTAFKNPYAVEFQKAVTQDRVAFAMSNLRRAQDTLMTGFHNVMTPGQCVYIMSSLQESEMGSDASTDLTSEQMRRRLVAKDQERAGLECKIGDSVMSVATGVSGHIVGFTNLVVDTGNGESSRILTQEQKQNIKEDFKTCSPERFAEGSGIFQVDSLSDKDTKFKVDPVTAYVVRWNDSDDVDIQDRSDFTTQDGSPYKTFNYNFAHNGGNESRRWFNASTRAKKTLQTFFDIRDKSQGQKDIFVFAGHSHQMMTMMKQVVPHTWWKAPFEWLPDQLRPSWATPETKLDGLWATQDKLGNGAAMEFYVERIPGWISGFSGFRIVEQSWKDLDDFGLRRALLTKRSQKNVRSKKDIDPTPELPLLSRVGNWFTSPERLWNVSSVAASSLDEGRRDQQQTAHV